MKFPKIFGGPVRSALTVIVALAGILVFGSGCETMRYGGSTICIGPFPIYNTRRGLRPIDEREANFIAIEMRLRELHGDEEYSRGIRYRE